MVNPIQSDLLAHSGIKHGFFTREGGVSQGMYEGLNVGIGSSDNAEHVRENRSRIASFFGLSEHALKSPYQVHSANVAQAPDNWQNGERPQVDGVISSSHEICVGVVTADCGPVLFADPENRVVGAAHAGWKGATQGVLENTIAAMEAAGAQRDKIRAVLGPTISQKNYEVGPEFVENLSAISSNNAQYFIDSNKADHAMFNLPAYIVDRLTSAGVKAGWTGQCTYEDPKMYFSYRRTTHKGEPDYGRQLSAIRLNVEQT